MKISLVGIHQKEESLTQARIEMKTLVVRLALKSYQGSLCDLRSSRCKAKGGPHGQAVSTKRSAGMDPGRAFVKTEKILAKHFGKRKRSYFCDYKNYTSARLEREDWVH